MDVLASVPPGRNTSKKVNRGVKGRVMYERSLGNVKWVLGSELVRERESNSNRVLV